MLCLKLKGAEERRVLSRLLAGSSNRFRTPLNRLSEVIKQVTTGVVHIGAGGGGVSGGVDGVNRRLSGCSPL